MERKIVIGMIVSTDFLASIQSIWNPDYVESESASTIATWCMDHFKKYKEAPKQEIQDVFARAKRNGLNQHKADYITEVLASLSDEYDRSHQFNVQHLLDQTEEYFKERNLTMLAEDVMAEIENKNLEEAERCILDHNKVELIQAVGIDPIKDMDAIDRAFEHKSTPLFTFPGALGTLLNDQLHRGSFLAFMGPEKRGKTWLLMMLYMQALKSRCKVAFFQAGDLEEEDFTMRLMCALTRKRPQAKFCKARLIPTLDCAHNQLNQCDMEERACDFGVMDEEQYKQLETLTRNDYKQLYEENDQLNYKPCKYCRNMNNGRFKGALWYREIEEVSPLTKEEAKKKALRYSKKIKDTKVATYANSTLTIAQIQHQLKLWEEQSNWVPDVIIIDYADILAPEDSRKEHRQQQNDTWKAGRSLSQTSHTLTVTVTQSDSGSYGRKNLGLANFSETKAKYAHVNGMYVMNQTDIEKAKGILRIGALLVREDESDGWKQAKVLQCLQRAIPYIDSYF